MKKLAILLMMPIVTACASGPLSEHRDLESGERQAGTVIYCSGYKTWRDCDHSAAKACPNGYDILEKEENLPTQSRMLRIQCK